MSVRPPVSYMFCFRFLLICYPLRSTRFHVLHHYYEIIRLLTTLQDALHFQDFACPYQPLLCVGDRQISQVCVKYLCMLATLYDPDGTYVLLRYRVHITACCTTERIGFRLSLLTRLNRFTLSHCGSHTPMPTLKPNLAASAPRLSTGCPLRLCRAWTLTMLYFTHRTGAPAD